MANRLPYFAFCRAEVVADVRRAMEAMGRGPETFVAPFVPSSPPPTSATPATHYMIQDMSGTDDDVAELNACINGDLPEHVEWGEEGIISAEDAIAAFGAGNVQIRAAGGLDDEGINGKTPQQWKAETLAELGLTEQPEDL